MKLICDCGNIEEFILPTDPEDRHSVDDSQHCYKKFESFYINSGHDELFISCKKCGLSIHIFT